ASDVHGTAIEATDGSIGSVDDFLFSDDRWTVRWAVIDTGNWLPGRRVLLPPDRLTLPADRSGNISVALTRKQVEDSPEIHRDPPVSRQQEMRFYSRLGPLLGFHGGKRGHGRARDYPPGHRTAADAATRG